MYALTAFFILTDILVNEVIATPVSVVTASISKISSNCIVLMWCTKDHF